MSTPNENLRIRHSRPLLSPAILAEELPVPESTAQLIRTARHTVADIVHGRDPRLLVITGPCSIHDPAAALEYAQRLSALVAPLAEELFLVMRVYFEKPRTQIGWKGLINDPHLDQTFRVNDGLRMARKVLLDIAGEGLPAATEFLDNTLGQYYADLISWGAIGARTTESQIHRQLASGLSMPVGFKNRTDGNVQVAVDAVRAASQPHWFPSLTMEGAPALLQTAGNPDCHVVLRGGTQPNFERTAIDAAITALAANAFNTGVIVDCSHGNSSKQPERQLEVALNVARQSAQDAASGNAKRIAGIMLESHLQAGNQSIEAKPLTYGQSITDGCISFEQTATLLTQLQETIKQRGTS